MQSLEFKIKTLTPIWTGGVGGKCDQLHETGIIGSLRWWYEAIVRGLGGYACDPTGDERCPQKQENEDRWCNVCHIFGAGGRAGKFRLDLSGQSSPAFPGSDQFNALPAGRNRGWFLGPGRVSQSLTLRFVLLRHDPCVEQTLKVLLKFINDWGAIGARMHIGYGVVQFFENGHPLSVSKADVRAFIEGATRRSVDINGKTHRVRSVACDFPSMSTAFLAKMPLVLAFPERFDHDINRARPNRRGTDSEVKHKQQQLSEWLKETDAPPLAPAIRNQLRFAAGLSISAQKNIFGEVSGQNRQGSHVGTSFAYKINGGRAYEIRAWAHFVKAQSSDIALVEQKFKDPSAWTVILKDSANKADTTKCEWRYLNNRCDVEQMLDGLI